MVGVVGTGGAGGGGGGGGSNISTTSPIWIASSAKVIMPVALLGWVFKIINWPSERRGSSLRALFGKRTLLAWVSSVVLALKERLSVGSLPIDSYVRVMRK